MKGKKAVQSKFPTARIKKIMQADEDVGKVAQGTPVVISRALELFLKDVISETAEIARVTGSKKLMPYHVKRLVQQNRQYDFLDDLVTPIADPTAGMAGTGSTKGGAGGRTQPQGSSSGSRAPVQGLTGSRTTTASSTSHAKPDPEDEDEDEDED